MKVSCIKPTPAAILLFLICLHFGFGNPNAAQLEEVLLQKLESYPDALAISFVLDQPISPARLRFFLDVDGRSSGEGATGADFMLEGETWFSYSGKDGEWSWSPINKAVVITDGNTHHFLIEKAPAFEQARWLAQTTTESWEVADQYPESGMKKAIWDTLPVLPTSELKSSFSDRSQTTPDGSSNVSAQAVMPKPVDLSELLAHLPSFLSPRLDAEVTRQTWTEVPLVENNPPSWIPQGWTTPLPLALTMKDAVTGAAVDLTPSRTYKSNSGQRWSGKALGVSWDIFAEKDDQGDLQLTGRIQAERDRCIRIGVGCRLDLKGWTWHDDFRFRRTIENTEDPYRNTGPFFFGYAGEQSLYPFGVVSKENLALIVETDPYEPRVCQIYAETESDFFGIYYDLGLTPETKKFPGTATFRCVLRSMAQGGPASFRHTLSTFYGRFPDYQKSRTGKAGLWMPFSDISKIPDAEDFGFAFFEKGTGPVRDASLIRKLGVLSLPYTEPWLHWLGLTEEMGWTDESALKQMEFLANRGDAQPNRFSSASLLGAVRTPDDKILMTFRNTPWSNGARMEVSTDPELPTTDAYPVNRAMAEWVDIRAAITKGQSEGIYLDSMSAMEVLNYDPRAMAVTDIPCTFDMQALKPGLAAPLANIKFTAALSGYLHQEGKYLMGNFPCWNHPFFMPYIDIPGEETTWFVGGQYKPLATLQLNFRRAISGHKPYGFLQATYFDEFKGAAMERYFKDCLFYAFQPSFFSHDAANDPYWENSTWLERDRHFFKTYMPFIQRLGTTGWEVEGPVSISSAAIWGEHFGTPDNGVFFYTMRNDSDVLEAADLDVNGLKGSWLCYNPFNGRISWFSGGDATGTPKFNVALRAHDVGLLVFVRADRLPDEIEFLQKWDGGCGLANLNISNLQSALQESESTIYCQVIHPAVSWIGSLNPLDIRIVNKGSSPIVLDDIECNATLPLSSCSILPGESTLLEESYRAWDMETQVPLTFACRCTTGGEQLKIQRSWLPLFTHPVEITGGPLEVFTLQSRGTIDLELHNHSSQTLPVRIEWMHGGEKSILTENLDPLESRHINLAVPVDPAEETLVSTSVFTGERLVFQETYSVTKLPEGSSLARDSRVRVTADSTYAGYNLKPLTDGRVDTEGLAWNSAAWASEESSSPHWVRITFPEPRPVSDMVLHWSEGNASRRGEIRGILASGKTLILASFDNENAAAEIKLGLKPAVVEAIEVYQPGGAGSATRPNLLWLREIEVH